MEGAAVVLLPNHLPKPRGREGQPSDPKMENTIIITIVIMYILLIIDCVIIIIIIIIIIHINV